MLSIDIGTLPASLASDLRRAVSIAAERIIDELEATHRENTTRGFKPDGTRQPGGGGADGVPLYGDGRFATGSIKLNKEDARELWPAPHMQRALQYVHARGQVTIWAELPVGFQERAREIMSEEITRALEGAGGFASVGAFDTSTGIV